jgi:hypothetical protein
MIEYFKSSFKADMALEAPPSIRERLEAHDGAAQKLSDSIRRRIDEVYEPLWEGSCNGRKTGISSVDIADAMVDFVPEIRRLANINGSLNLAFDLMMHLANHYYGELDGGGDGGDQLCDGPADDLLVQILQRMEEEVLCFKPEKELATLKAHAKELDDYGFESFFAKSIHEMSTWLEALESAKVFWQQQQTLEPPHLEP